MSENKKEISTTVETQTQDDSTKLVDDEYHIYNYLKQHPSLLIAIISAFVAVVSVVLNFAAFLSTNSYLAYFRVDNVIYKPSTPFVYLMAIVLIFSAILILFQGFIARTFDSYLPYKMRFLRSKYSLKKIKKEYKKGKKVRKSIEQSLSHNLETGVEDEKTNQVKKELAELNENSEKIWCEFISIKKGLHKCHAFYYVLIGISCLLAWIALCLVFVLVISCISYEWDKILLSAAIFSAIYVLMFVVENWFFSCVIKINKNKIKSDARLDVDLYDDLPDFPISSLLGGNLRSLFNDSNCKRFVSMIVLILAILVFVCSWSGSQGASKQREFVVVDVADEAYVLIYNNGENAILEKDTIMGDTVIIDTTHQKRISLNNIDMRRYTFSKVDIVMTKKMIHRAGGKFRFGRN